MYLNTSEALNETANFSPHRHGSDRIDALRSGDGDRIARERLKHATNPFSGAMDADRITVFLGPQDSRTSLQIIGETVGSQVGGTFLRRTREESEAGTAVRGEMAD